MIDRFIPAIFVLLWSTGWIVAKFGAFHASPLLFLVIRFALAIVLFYGICLFSGARWLGSRSATLHAAVSGVFLHGIYLSGVWWSIAHGVPAGISGLISALQPLMTAVAAPFLVGERLSGKQKLGLALGFLGIIIAIAPKLIVTDASAVPLIPLLVNVAGMAAVTYGSIYQKQHLHSGDLRTIASCNISVLSWCLPRSPSLSKRPTSTIPLPYGPQWRGPCWRFRPAPSRCFFICCARDRCRRRRP